MKSGTLALVVALVLVGVVQLRVPESVAQDSTVLPRLAPVVELSEALTTSDAQRAQACSSPAFWTQLAAKLPDTGPWELGTFSAHGMTQSGFALKPGYAVVHALRSRPNGVEEFVSFTVRREPTGVWKVVGGFCP